MTLARSLSPSGLHAARWQGAVQFIPQLSSKFPRLEPCHCKVRRFYEPQRCGLGQFVSATGSSIPAVWVCLSSHIEISCLGMAKKATSVEIYWHSMYFYVFLCHSHRCHSPYSPSMYFNVMFVVSISGPGNSVSWWRCSAPGFCRCAVALFADRARGNHTAMASKAARNVWNAAIQAESWRLLLCVFVWWCLVHEDHKYVFHFVSVFTHLTKVSCLWQRTLRSTGVSDSNWLDWGYGRWKLRRPTGAAGHRPLDYKALSGDGNVSSPIPR